MVTTKVIVTGLENINIIQQFTAFYCNKIGHSGIAANLLRLHPPSKLIGFKIFNILSFSPDFPFPSIPFHGLPPGGRSEK